MTVIRVFLTLTAFIALHAQAQNLATKQYKEDFEYFFRTIRENYCYWDKKQIDWNKTRSLYAPMIDTVRSNYYFVVILEKMFHELYDHHASLNTNTGESSKLVPSGTDIWAAYKNNKPVIEEVKQGSAAEKAGIQRGAEIIAVNAVAVEEAVTKFLPRTALTPTNEMKNYALRVVLAGTHNTKRILTLKQKGNIQQFEPDNYKADPTQGMIESCINGNIGYIKINDQLWNNQLIPAFDSVLNTMLHTKGLVLDLRNTPSGGNTTVARAIIGRFIDKAGYYQHHELTAEEVQYGVRRSWTEIVSPRGTRYTKPLVLLVNHWTGSVGEGITIGFDALKRARIMGTQMAGLNGAIYSYRMPNTKIGFSFPVEKLLHVNGKAREDYRPAVTIVPVAGKDAALEAALQWLNKR